MTEPFDQNVLVNKTNALLEESERVGDKWGQDNDSTEPGYIWGYTLGALLAFAGLSIMLLDWVYMANLKESHGVPYFEQSEGFVGGAVTFVIGCLLLNKATFGWILLLVFLVKSGFSFLTALLFPIDYPEGFGPTAIDQIVDVGFTLGVFLFLAAQIWYLWQFKTRNV